MKNKKLEALLLVIVLALAFGLRIAFLYNVPQPPLQYDAISYDTMVRQIIEKHFYAYQQGVPNAFTTPGYPVFLTIIYKVFGYGQGSPLVAVKIVQILLSVLTIYFLYLLGRLVAGSRVGLMSAFLAAIYLDAIWVPTTILTESLYTFLFIAYLYVQLLAFKKKNNITHALAGLLLGFAVLVRPLIAPLIVLPYIYYFLTDKDKSVFKSLFFNATAFIAVMMPWWIRNLIVMKKFVPFATQQDPLLRGTYPYEVGIENMPMPPADQNAVAVKRLIDGFLTQPLLYLKWYTIGKFDWLYFKVYYYVDESISFLRFLFNLHFLYAWVGWIGILWSVIKKEIRLLALYVIFLTAATMLFVSTSRYAYPQMHILILFTAMILDTLFFVRKDKKIELDQKVED